MNERQVFADGLALLGLDPVPARISRLLDYAEQLAKWNRVYNLTAIPPRKTITHHLLDSLAIAGLVGGQRIIDVGSGAGLPGIPLAIFHPDKHFTLLDSAGKKTRFLEHARIRLALDNVDVVQGRAEDFIGHYDRVVCRGLGSLAEIARMAAHLAGPSGRILALKGALADAETTAVSPPVCIEYIQPLAVPGVDGTRSVVVMKRSR